MDHADMLGVFIMGPDSLSRRAQAGMRSGQELPRPTGETLTTLEGFGIKFGGDAGRRGFAQVELPPGWRVVPANHRLYSHLHDEKGRVRAEIMYDGQDGKSWISLRRRFRGETGHDDYSDRTAPAIPEIVDSNGNVLWRGKSIPTKKNEDPFKPSASDRAREIAWKKLVELAPQCESYTAYWGDDGDVIVWPPHETPPDTRRSYSLITRCLNNGNQQDGGEHAACKAESDAEAKTKLLKSLDGLTSHYDEVAWTIQCGDRVVERGTVCKPPPPRRSRNGGLMGPDGREYYFFDGRLGPPPWIDDGGY